MCSSLHRLKQDVANLTLYMLESIAEQKMALAAYSTQNDILQLTSFQLDLVDKVIAVLKPIEEITQSISSEESSASVIIPFVRGLRRSLECHDQDSGVRTMKRDILASLNRRYCDVESNELLVLATRLDPCFKDKFFRQQANAKELLEKRVAELPVVQQQFSGTTDSGEPSPKHPKTAILKCLSEILEEAGVGKLKALITLDMPLFGGKKINHVFQFLPIWLYDTCHPLRRPPYLNDFFL